MSPVDRRANARLERFPRLRGDEPEYVGGAFDLLWFSPPTRG